jgi:arsenate reductase
MAEALLRFLAGDRCEVFSAGTEPSSVDPRAIAVLQELGIPTDGLRSKSVEELAGWQFDIVLTVCDSAQERCPVFPGAPRYLHWSLPDPAQARGEPEEVLAVFRRVRGELLERLQTELLPVLQKA